MLRIIGRIILVPLGIVFAAIAAFAFLGVVGLVQPGFSEAVAIHATQAIEQLFHTLLEGPDAITQYGLSLALFSRFVVVVLFLPVSITAAVAEVFGLRSFFLQVLMTAFLTALVSFAMMPGVTAGASYLSVMAGLLAATGALAGMVYWMIAGHSAGSNPPTIEDRATVRAPSPSRK